MRVYVSCSEAPRISHNAAGVEELEDEVGNGGAGGGGACEDKLFEIEARHDLPRRSSKSPAPALLFRLESFGTSTGAKFFAAPTTSQIEKTKYKSQ